MVEPVDFIISGDSSLSESLTKRLEELILDGTLKPGRKLPSERQLSERLGVSRNILREALKTIRGRGLINTRHGRGSIVASLVPEFNHKNPLTLLYGEHARILYDLLEVREVLEAQAAFLAAQRATREDISHIRQAFKALEELVGDVAAPEEAALRDHAFHQSIYEASNNPVLVHTLKSLVQPMRDSVLASVKNLYHRPASKKRIDTRHKQIYNAIIRGQPEKAQRAAAAHVRDVRESLLEIEKEERRLDRSSSWEAIIG